MRCFLLMLAACTYITLPAAALKCYVCDSQTDSRCTDFYRMPSVDCEAQRGLDRPPATGCLVQMHRNVHDGHEGVSRDCYYGALEDKYRACERRISSISSLREIWYCNVCDSGDKCNGYMIAGSSSVTASLAMALALIGVTWLGR